MILSVVSIFVSLPFTISTSFIIVAGLKKCIPINLSGNFNSDAILEIEIEEVLVAKTQLAEIFFSSILKIFFFVSKFSLAASITKST